MNISANTYARYNHFGEIRTIIWKKNVFMKYNCPAYNILYTYKIVYQNKIKDFCGLGKRDAFTRF